MNSNMVGRWLLCLLLSLGTGLSGCSKKHKASYPLWNGPGGAAPAESVVDYAKRLGRSAELTLDLGNGVQMKLALIPAAKFRMGSPKEEIGRTASESDVREVTLTQPFYMGIHEVTQEQYQQVMGKNSSSFTDPKNPVDTVSWQDAADFCEKVSTLCKRTVRLPTEAEWEFACRAGTTTPFHTGPTVRGDQANYNGLNPYGGAAKSEFRQKTTAVGSFPPNAFGLHDMHGNVGEWCSDWLAEAGEAPQDVDPTGPSSGASRLLRGGSWAIHPKNCRSASRNWAGPGAAYYHFGFRAVVELE